MLMLCDVLSLVVDNLQSSNNYSQHHELFRYSINLSPINLLPLQIPISLHCFSSAISPIGLSHILRFSLIILILASLILKCAILSRSSKLLYSFFGRNMSFTAPSAAPSAAGRTFDFGRTYVVRPKGKHQATIVWLHGLGDNGNSWSTLLETLPLPNIKWICPTAPQRPVTLFGGFPSTAWFDVNDLSENANDDVHGLEASATYVASLLANEPADIKLGVGGFSMGAATSLYCATCFARGKFENGNQFSQNISAVVGLSGWLPCAKTLSSKLEGVAEASGRAASLPILLCHGKGDDVVAYKFGEKSAEKVTSTGFRDVTFKSYATLGHYTIPEEMDEVCAWLSSKMGLDGK